MNWTYKFKQASIKSDPFGTDAVIPPPVVVVKQEPDHLVFGLLWMTGLTLGSYWLAKKIQKQVRL